MGRSKIASGVGRNAFYVARMRNARKGPGLRLQPSATESRRPWAAVEFPASRKRAGNSRFFRKENPKTMNKSSALRTNSLRG